MQTQTADTLDATRRQELEFPSCGTRCAAWFYPAHEVDEPAPIVVLAHGLSGTRRDGLGPFAQRFAEAGIAALIFDHRGFDVKQIAKVVIGYQPRLGIVGRNDENDVVEDSTVDEESAEADEKSEDE